MSRPVVHISEAEATGDFAAVLARVREGMEVIIERDARPVAVIRSVEPLGGRPLSESIALAEAHAKEFGHEPTLDSDFASDLTEIISHRKPRNSATWE